jgi:hypothetical protein
MSIGENFQFFTLNFYNYDMEGFYSFQFSDGIYVVKNE